MPTTPNLGLTKLATGQESKEITINANYDLIDAAALGGGGGAGNAFVSSDYASLAAAVTAIGAASGSLRIEAAGFSSGATTTVPATLIIDWGDLGSLSLTTGHVVTIKSDLSTYPVRKLFNNALTSQGTISLDGNGMHVPLWSEWWGAVGNDSTDDTGAWQACLDALTSAGGGCIRLGLKSYVIAGPLQDVLFSSSQLLLPRVSPDETQIIVRLEGVAPPGVVSSDVDRVSMLRSTLSIARTFTADSSTDIITVTAHDFVAGQILFAHNAGGGLPGGLVVVTEYFVRDVTANTFKLAATSGGAAIDITSNGTGTNSVTPFGSLIGGRPNSGSGTASQNEDAHNAMNWIALETNNVCFRAPANPSINAVDLRFIPTINMQNTRIDVTGMSMTLGGGVIPDLVCTEPTTPTSYGLLTPLAYIPNACLLHNVEILGYYNGMRWGELVHASYLEIGACKLAIEMRQGTHRSTAQELLFVACASLLEMKGADPYFTTVDADVYNIISVDAFDFENATGAGGMAWTTTTSHISDANNQLRGNINWSSFWSMLKTGGANLRLHQTNKPQHLYRPFTNVTGTDLDTTDHAVAEIYRGLSTSDASKLAWLLLTSKQTSTANPVGILAFINDHIADGNNKILGQIGGWTDGATNRGRVDLYTADPAGTLTVRTIWDCNGNLIQGKMALYGEGSALTVSSNAIAPLFRYHQVGAGLIKNITLPPGPGAGVVHEFWILPTAAFTWDTTGNIATTAGTAVLAVPILAQWWPSAAKWTLQ